MLLECKCTGTTASENCKIKKMINFYINIWFIYYINITKIKNKKNNIKFQLLIHF